MWSDQYNYLNICKDTLLSEYCSTINLNGFLSEISELEKYGDFKFRNKKTFPFIDLQLLDTKNIDNWSENDRSSKTNLIAIVCSKEEDEFKKIEKILKRIALFLKWDITNEE